MYSDRRQDVRRKTLRDLGGDDNVAEELLAYCENPFSQEALPPPPVFPMQEEGHVEDWRTYIADRGNDPFGFLQERIPQLNIPVQQGISRTEAYARVVRRGQPFDEKAFGGRLCLEHPGLFNMSIHESGAGALPVLYSPHRADFELLVRALAFRNEPEGINPSVNAQFISGLINWDRVRRYEKQLKEKQGASANDAFWRVEMSRVATSEKWRFYDRLIVIGAHPYSGTSAKQLGLPWDERTWIEKSTALRLEHEFAHYAVLRLYGKLGHTLLDEIISDWAGMTAVMSRFSAQRLLLFLGLGDWPRVGDSGRIHAYRRSLSDVSFLLLCALTVKVAQGLESLSRTFYDPKCRYRFLLALTRLTLELLACEERFAFFTEAYEEAGRLLGDTERRCSSIKRAESCGD